MVVIMEVFKLGIFEKSKFDALTAIFVGMMIIFWVLPFSVDAADTTIVRIDPSNQTISPGENFTVDIYCVPSQPIKSFEFKLSFDASIIQAELVSEGNIFDGNPQPGKIFRIGPVL